MLRRSLTLLLVVSLLLSALSFASARPEADSVILLIGDGMGFNHIELTRLALGGNPLAMQRLPYSGLVATHSADSPVTDSAAAATALAAGVKTNNGMLAVSPGGQRLETILERCLEKGKAAGLVTNDALWGATPAAFAVHLGSRGEYAEIARQLAESKVQVMLGCGADEMKPKAAGGARKDDLDLVKALQGRGYDVVTTREEMRKAARPQLVGLFGDEAPSVAEMTEAALARLEQSKRGFFLMVEECGSDGGGHGSDPLRVVRAVRSLDKTVQVAVDHARRRGRTLVLVTADHETGGLLIDAPARAPLLTRATASAREIVKQFSDNRANVAVVLKERAGVDDLTPAELEKIQKASNPTEAVLAVLSARAGVRWTGQGHHTGVPVRVFAFGPGAERFTGTLDNTQLSGLIAETLGLGTFPKP